MFKEGDKVGCIKPSKSIHYGKPYIITRICLNPKTQLKTYYKFDGLQGAFRCDRFVDYKIFERLNKIECLKKEIK